MTDIELNININRLLGFCSHDNVSQIWNECLDCHKHGDDLKLVDFLTWEGFGIAWEFMRRRGDWEDFWDFLLEELVDRLPLNCKPSYMEVMRMVTSKINPRELVEAVVRFFEEVK